MSVRRRPSLWSYFSFSSKPGTRYGRSDSVTSNLRHNDPYEKPNRHSSSIHGGMTQAGRARLIKIVSVVGLLLLGVWLFVPRDREKAEGIVGVNPGGRQQESHGQVAVDSAAGTTKCKTSSHFAKPVVQYALMVDAGSQGSRIHTYRFNNCGNAPELEKEGFWNIEPGLSSYKEDSEGAAKSLDVLLDAAVKEVPESLRSCTPIAVKATAGLRMLGEEMAQKILDAVRHRLETKYPFAVVPGDGVQIMDGRDEGIYAWITANYLLGKIGTSDKTPTAAVFDLGGGSTQIVFEPTFNSASGGMPEHLQDGDHKYVLNFGNREFNLYQHSHLGYGLKEARKAIHQSVFESATHTAGLTTWPKDKPIINPCIPPGMTKLVNVTLPQTSSSTTTNEHTLLEVTMKGPPEPSAPQCRSIAESTLHKEAACNLTPCSFNGIHQPSLERTFSREDVYIFSYFYDRIKPLGMPESFSIKELKDLTAKVCMGEEGWSSFQSTEGAIEQLKKRAEHCLDLNFMVALLHTGYEMPIDRELKMAKKIKGKELGWCLGASLPLLDQGKGGWQCRIREVS